MQGELLMIIGAVMGSVRAMSSGLLVSLFLWLEDFAQIWGRIKGWVNYPFQFGKIEFSLSTLVQGVAVLLIAIFVSRWLRKLFERRMSDKARVDPGIRYTVMRLIHYFITTVGLLF